MGQKTNKIVRIMDFRGTYKGGGGPDKTILNSAKMHDKKRVFVLVTYIRDPKNKEFQITNRAKKMGIPYIEVYDRRLLDLRCLYELHSLVNKHKIDMIHAHDDKTLLYGWLLKLLNPKLVIIFTCHLLLDYDRNDFHARKAYWNYLVRDKIAAFLMKMFSKPAMAVSGATKQQLVDRGFKEKDVVVLYNGIDTETWKKSKCHQPVLKRELWVKETDFLIGTVARISYQKDFPTFIKVAKIVTDRLPDAQFVIVGDGRADELEKLKQDVREAGLENSIHFTGHRNNLLDVYTSFDLFLMTSIVEGLPNTVLEAMAMEIPVVSTSVSGVPELVSNNKTGFLCDMRDYKDLAEKVLTLLENKSLREKFAVQSRKRIETLFSFSERVKKLETMYESYAKSR